jgi:predicted TIM-barrel fold metal-dependent hydrolase
MLCVDAQVHIWKEGKPHSHHDQRPLLADRYLEMMKEAGVDRAVLVPPTWEPTVNAPSIEAARLHPDRFAIMGRLAVNQPESRTLLETWKQQPGMLGMRFLFAHPEQRAWLENGSVDWVWPAAERLGLPVMVYMSGILPELEKVAERHPGLKLIVDSLGIPMGTQDDAAFAHLPSLIDLAKYPNVALKAVGIPAYSTEPYPHRGIHQYLHRVYDAFGPERIFWGTDITRMKCSYRRCVTLFTEELSWLTAYDKEQIMGTALCRWIGWDLPK